MSDLLVTYEGLSLPPKACSEAPPAGKKDAAPAVDACSIELPLIASNETDAKARTLRFDRKKDQFVLSTSNSSDNLTWVGKQSNLAEILDVLRVLEATLRKAEVESVEVYSMKLSIVQYLITGKVLLHGSEEKNLKRPRTEVDLAERMLEIFSISSDQAISNFIGPINVFRADSSIQEGAKDRIRFLNQVLDLRPKYRNLRAHFAESAALDRWLELKGKERKNYQDLLAFLRQTVVNDALSKPIRYDESFDASYRAYLALHPELTEEAGKDAYCKSLETGLAELRGGRGVAKDWIAECRAVMDWSSLPADEALSKSLRHSFLSEAARPLLEQAIEDESRKANMKVDWLADRGRFAQAYQLLEAQLQVKADGENSPTLILKPSDLRVQLNIWIGSNLVKRREHLLAALALLRRTFGESGNPPAVRVFHQGQFVLAEWKLDAKDLKEIREYQAELEKQIQVSETRSEIWLPIVEGSTCAAGAIGLGFSTFGGLESNPELKTGLGATSAGLAGAGCSALLGHYLWPKLGKVRNRYLWEGLTGAAGAAVGVGLYFLARSAFGDLGNPVKYPVDEYGP